MELSPNVQNIVDGISTLSVLELADLVKALEKTFGVSAAAPVAIAAAPAAAAAPAEEEQIERTEFNLILTDVGDKKLQVIKEVRAVTNLGLKEAKDFVEGPMPQVLKENVPKAEVDEIKAKFEAVGAKITVK